MRLTLKELCNGESTCVCNIAQTRTLLSDSTDIEECDIVVRNDDLTGHILPERNLYFLVNNLYISFINFISAAWFINNYISSQFGTSRAVIRNSAIFKDLILFIYSFF